MRVNGVAYPPRLSERRVATLEISDGRRISLAVEAEKVVQCEVVQLTLSQPIGNLPVRIVFPQGWVFIPENRADIHLLGIRQPKAAVWVHRLEANLGLVFLSLILCVALGWGGYRYFIPWMSSCIAGWLPERIPMLVGDKVLEQLDAQFKPSHLSVERQQAIQQRLSANLRKLPKMPFPVQIEFRSNPHRFINAFTLPGGKIVLLDSMVQLAQSDQQLDGVIFHELGHVYYRHVTTQLVESGLTAVVASMVTGDSSQVVHYMVGAGLFLLRTGLSRESERAADQFAKRAMIMIYGTSAPLAEMFEQMQQARKRTIPLWLSTHPDVQERIRNMRK
jgi:Zn-dependent protease with chaperone function